MGLVVSYEDVMIASRRADDEHEENKTKCNALIGCALELLFALRIANWTAASAGLLPLPLPLDLVTKAREEGREVSFLIAA